jgi:peptidyl-tRNA hydrolase, PTH1 family
MLIIGLGNPTSKHAHNRHNIGFMWVDMIARHYNFSPWRTKFQSEICDGEIAGFKISLQKPQTYMNLSGQAVAEATRFYKIPLNEIIVAHDELDLPFAKSRLKQGGGHAGHNGLRSISAHLTDNYARIRLGIGHPGDKAQVHNHVLGDFAKSEFPMLDDFLHAHTKHLSLLIKGENSSYMNKVTEELQALSRP